jgi:transcription initiation factor TFIIIB Brf1 subunit/transcription initiation factor TFIIB
MAFKSMGLYWTKTRVAQIFEIDLGEIRRGLTIFSELIKNQPNLLAKVTGCKQYIHWFSVGLGLPRGISTLCCKLFKALSQRGIGYSKQPQSVAAGCLWVICQELAPQITIDKIVTITGISKATIREVLKLMGGIDRYCLLSVFAADICESFDVTNPLTLSKIQRVVKGLYSVLHHLVKQSNFWGISCFAVYFILVLNDAPFNEAKFLQQSNIRADTILQLSKCIVPFRDSIIELALKG